MCVERAQEAGHVGVPGDGPARRGRDQVAIRGRTGQSGAPRDLPSQRSGSRRVARGRCDRVLLPARKPPKTQSGLEPSRTRCGRDCATEPSPARPVRAPGPSRILLRCRPHQMRPLRVRGWRPPGGCPACWQAPACLASCVACRPPGGWAAAPQVRGCRHSPPLAFRRTGNPALPGLHRWYTAGSPRLAIKKAWRRHPRPSDSRQPPAR